MFIYNRYLYIVAELLESGIVEIEKGFVNLTSWLKFTFKFTYDLKKSQATCMEMSNTHVHLCSRDLK